MLQNYRKLKRKTIPIHGGFSNETMTIKKELWKEVYANRNQIKLSYLRHRKVICKGRIEKR